MPLEFSINEEIDEEIDDENDDMIPITIDKDAE